MSTEAMSTDAMSLEALSPGARRTLAGGASR